MSFARYPAYKDSGVAWLGDVPTHWHITLIKHTSYLKARVGWKGLTSEESKEQSFAYLVTGSDFRDKYVNWDACYQVEQGRYEDDPFIQLQDGDLLVTKDGTIGKLAIVSNLDRPACLNSGIFVVRPLTTYTTEFMYWILSSKVFSVFCDLESFGSTINHLYQNVFERFSFPAPPLPEQTQIAAFLDRETAKIDALVAEQRRLMELLKEKRQAVISHAVTRGLNPDAPMKPSGVEWLGDVPEHWEVRRVKDYFRTCSGGTPNTGQQELYYSDEENGIPWVRTTDLRNDILREVVVFITERALLDTACCVLPVGTVLVAMYGGDGTVGKNGLLAIPAAINQAVCGLLPSESHSSEYAFRFMQFYRPHWMIGAESSRKDPNISQERVRNAPFLRPPRLEQEAIVTFLNRQLLVFDTLTTEAQHAIDLLQERRTALISAAVTGQIDIRNAA